MRLARLRLARLRRIARASKTAGAAAALGLIGLTLGANAIVEPYGEDGFGWSKGGAVPVVIVPGALVHADGTPSAVLEDRLECALTAWNLELTGKILVSGDHARADYDEVNAMRSWLVARGVPSEAIFMDHAGLRTWDTMQRAVKVFGVRRAAICTQRVNMARTLYLAEKAGIEAVGVVADAQYYGNERRQRYRERLAAVLAVWDVAVGRTPRHLGPPVPLDGPAWATHDRWTEVADRASSVRSGR